MKVKRRLIGAVALIVAGLLSGGALVAQAREEKALKVKDLPERWRVWIEEEVYPLISKEQKDAFLRLETEAQRQAFEERLWVLWGRQTGRGSAFRGMYQDRLATCRLEFGNTSEDRARVLLIHGPPTFRLKTRCDEIFHPMDIWGWAYIEGLGERVIVVFYQPDGLGPFRMWDGFNGLRDLYTFMAWEELSRGYRSQLDRPEYRCPDGDQVLGLLGAASGWARDPRFHEAMWALREERVQGGESSSRRFMEFSALLDETSEPLDFSITDSARGVKGGKVRMGFSVAVPGDVLGTSEVGDVAVAQVDVVGEISRGSTMVDRFRYLFSVPATTDELAFLVERFLRPGDYELRLKVEDIHSKHAGVEELTFSADPTAVVAPVEEAVGGATEVDLGTIETGGEADAPPPIIRLVGPAGEALSGLQRFEAVAQEEVARVVFQMNGEELLSKNRPPFDIDLDLGPLPRLTTVSVIAYDANETEIGRDQISLNVGRERFYVRLEPLSPNETEGGKVRVAADLNTPSDPPFDRLEMYWNDRLLATLYQQPFEAWVKLDQRDQFGYLRAVAWLEDGSQAEDIQFVNAPEFGSIVDVTAVELPVTVFDRAGKPVESLKLEDFTVLEDDVVQTISHCALFKDLPVRLGIAIDTSGSMEETLPEVQRVVMGFLRELLRPRDRAFIEVFSDQPDLLASFTADFTTLENALLTLFADRSTALYDSMIMGLFQFSGVRGRRAMIVLTDGEDTASKNDFEAVLGYAQRSGVTIYTVGIDLPASKVLTRWQLKKVAEVTGGRAFFISRKTNLETIYDIINHELRSQYVLAYTSGSTKAPDELRKIKVEVSQPRLHVRTISGYYPVR